MVFIKIKNFCLAKRKKPVKRMKKQATDRETLFRKHIYDKGLVIYKDKKLKLNN